ncbi:MAG: hypothetical protein EA397_13320 [Deltaproteobacteria bacterium]|nr:MAG: hypothetical protein EA397_13320 [Deltaproteobacteria bacterium]
MRNTSIIAGGVGVALVLVLLLLVGVIGGVALVSYAPPGPIPPDQVRRTIEQHHEALGVCAIGLSQPSELNATLTLLRGELRSLSITDATLPQRNAACVAEVLQGLPWPQGHAAVRVPIRMDP